MATVGIHLLSARKVQTARDGDHFDGDGLTLHIEGSNGSWLWKYTSPTGRRPEMGLGKVKRNTLAEAGKSLTDARDMVAAGRRLLRDGIDPIEHRDAKRAELRQVEQAKKAEVKRAATTLARVARDYHERVIEPNRTSKHAAQWITSLETHVPESMWHKAIDEVTGPELLDFIIELQAKVPETASRVRQRLEAIFDDAEFRGLSAGNPARAIRRKLSETKKARKRGSFAALPYAQVPAFVKLLQAREGVSARALEFAVLTTARTGEVIGATWDEFDLAAGVWTVPAARMKGGERHTVYLSERAREIVTGMQELAQRFVFPAPTLDDKPLSNMAMLTLLRRMDADKTTTVHGLCRASFSTWAYETGAARPEVIEACLAHREADKVKAAYNRAQFASERAALLAAWADHCAGKAPENNVIPITKGKTAA
ncbi:MAG: tyrosine-type recombinase/integrase [Burkholderiaceae bacterium]|nr:tyrosine-type recombinase/integrase [Burkholderiaceae bacterium]